MVGHGVNFFARLSRGGMVPIGCRRRSRVGISLVWYTRVQEPEEPRKAHQGLRTGSMVQQTQRWHGYWMPKATQS